MARLLLAAVSAAGIEARVPSRMSTRSRTPDTAALNHLRARALDEAERIIATLVAPDAWRPDVWITYHPYYKAPDWIGSTVARALAIPYVVAEASYAAKRDRDAWAPWQREVLTHLRQADRVLCLSDGDRAGLQSLVAADRLIDLPPFLDTGPFANTSAERADVNGPVRLITVAMMRDGVKLGSYRHLAAALQQLGARDWQLMIVGDGPMRGTVEAAFAGLPAERLVWRGLADADSIRALLAASDLFFWPGLGEAFGMVYLEAAAAGVPSVAYASGGIDAVIRNGATGLLVEEGDCTALATAISQLIDDPRRRHQLGAAAHAFAHGERSLHRAQSIINSALLPLVSGTRP